jgi:hypothetical protein
LKTLQYRQGLAAAAAAAAAGYSEKYQLTCSQSRQLSESLGAENPAGLFHSCVERRIWWRGRSSRQFSESSEVETPARNKHNSQVSETTAAEQAWSPAALQKDCSSNKNL